MSWSESDFNNVGKQAFQFNDEVNEDSQPDDTCGTLHEEECACTMEKSNGSAHVANYSEQKLDDMETIVHEEETKKYDVNIEVDVEDGLCHRFEVVAASR